MCSSQEDLFADNFKSGRPEHTEDYFQEVEAPEFVLDGGTVKHNFPNSNISVDIVTLFAENDKTVNCTVNVKFSGFTKAFTFSSPIAEVDDVVLSARVLLLSSKLKLPSPTEYPIRHEFLKQLIGFTSEEVIILGTFDGCVLAFPLEELVELRRVFYFPKYQPICDFSVLYHVSSLENDDVDADIDECLFAITNKNLLSAYYLTPDRGSELVFYQLPPLDHGSNNHRISSCTAQGSWLHVLSSEGYLLSLVFTHTEGKLICTPADYPNRPPRRIYPFTGEISPSDKAPVVGIVDLNISRSAEEISRAFRWRPFEIKELIMSGGHIVAVNMYTGNRLPLDEYISSYVNSKADKDNLLDSLSPLKSEVTFHRLYRAVVDTLFIGTSSKHHLLDTSVRLKNLQDLPGYCEFHAGQSLSTVALNIQIVLPSSNDIAYRSEWVDFSNISPSELLGLVLTDPSPLPLFFEEVRILRNSLSIAVEVKPVSSTSNISHFYNEKWVNSSSHSNIHQVTYHLPNSLFNKESSFNVEVTVFLELNSSESVIPSPLRCKIHKRITTALDLLRPHDLSSTNSFLSLPVRLPPIANLMSKFEELFKFYDFPLKEKKGVLFLQYLAPSSPGVEVRLNVEEGGFRIFSSNLAVLVQLHETFQHYIQRFIGDEGEAVSVDDLRREYAFLESMEAHLSLKRTSDDIQSYLDAYGFLRNIEISLTNVPNLCKAVWNAQASHRLVNQINAEIEELFERVLSHPPLDSAEHESFATAKYTSFMESSSQWRWLFMQMLITLPGESMLTFLRKRLLSPTVTPNGFNLEILLSIVSTIVVCCKRGTWLIIKLIHDILMNIFSSTPVKDSDGVSNQYPDLAIILDDSISSLVSQSSASSAINSIDPVEWKFTQLYHTFFLVRQLSVEDSRITAFSFAQWWRENFSASPITQKEGYVGGVLATRRGVELLASLLIRILPFERNPIHLAAQLAAPSPFWASMKGKSGGAEKGEAECCPTWNAYVDVARGRLAELRMDRGNAMVTSSAKLTGWPSEVETLVEDFMKTENRDADVRRLPSSLMEMHLFRGQYLRDTVLPLLRTPPPNISEEQRIASEVLLRTIEIHLVKSCTSVGEGPDQPPRSPKKIVRGKRARLRK